MPHTHTHQELELNLVLRGRARYIVGTRYIDLVPRALLWLFPEQDHMLVDLSADFQMWIGVWRPALVRQAASTAAYRVLSEADPAGDFCRLLRREHFSLLDELLCRLHDENSGPTSDAGYVYALLKAWDCFREAGTAPDAGDVHPAVARAARILQEDDGQINSDELSRDAGLSRSQLSRLFHRQTGLTLVQYRNRLRIERFLALYGSGQRLNMLQAAYEAGFGSYPQFHRVFRQIMGCRPTDYRRGL